MANTYTQLHIQIIFAVKYREAMISESWESSLYKYITTIKVGLNGKKDIEYFPILILMFTKNQKEHHRKQTFKYQTFSLCKLIKSPPPTAPNIVDKSTDYKSTSCLLPPACIYYLGILLLGYLLRR